VPDLYEEAEAMLAEVDAELWNYSGTYTASEVNMTGSINIDDGLNKLPVDYGECLRLLTPGTAGGCVDDATKQATTYIDALQEARRVCVFYDARSILLLAARRLTKLAHDSTGCLRLRMVTTSVQLYII
jgi:hypothetical protein